MPSSDDVRRRFGPPRPAPSAAPPPTTATAGTGRADRRRAAGQLADTGITWDTAALDLSAIHPGPVDRARARFRASLPDLIWNAARLEGNTYTLPEVRTLLEGVTVGGKPLSDERQIIALSEGYTALDALVGDGTFSPTKEVSDTLHALIARHEAIESGHFRGEGNARGGGAVRLADGGSVDGVDHGTGGADLIARHATLLARLAETPDPRLQALIYFASAARTQFYVDGNKRTARLVASGILLREGYDALNVPYARRLEFNVALDTLFTTDDATSLMRFLADCLTLA
ncbi:hypothetical protein [Nocardioides sp.]|uniref:hypothetical protein n=1 Tax=Nocardioides sp. TaxID=35761 RepID=UPI002614114B|nr:hypothetical protein [Nocardioides sp.]